MDVRNFFSTMAGVHATIDIGYQRISKTLFRKLEISNRIPFVRNVLELTHLLVCIRRWEKEPSSEGTEKVNLGIILIIVINRLPRSMMPTVQSQCKSIPNRPTFAREVIVPTPIFRCQETPNLNQSRQSSHALDIQSDVNSLLAFWDDLILSLPL